MAKSKTTIIVDRFEGDIAVCELPTREMINLPRWLLPKGVRESDVIDVTMETNDLVAKSSQRNIEALFNELLK